MSDLPVVVKYPFEIQNGSVATATSPDTIIHSQVLFCLGSETGERVMYPEWGVEIMNADFAMGASIEEAVSSGIHAAFYKWFPEFELREVKFVRHADYQTTILVEVRYGASGLSTDSIARVGFQVPDGTALMSRG